MSITAVAIATRTTADSRCRGSAMMLCSTSIVDMIGHDDGGEAWTILARQEQLASRMRKSVMVG